MNAYELSKELRKSIYEQIANINFHDVADFIDQQADRIAELERQLKTVQWALAKNVDILGEMGWHQVNKDGYVKPTPQTKELSDEEIEQLQAEYDIDSGLTHHSVKDFARAILRKAQEK